MSVGSFVTAFFSRYTKNEKPISQRERRGGAGGGGEYSHRERHGLFGQEFCTHVYARVYCAPVALI